MKLNLSVFFCCCLFHILSAAERFHQEKFLWGVSTAAYQIEGEALGYGRGPSIWDTFAAIPGKIKNGDNASIADDSYNLVNTDIQILKDLGVNAYRFSLSWSRILPTGWGAINQIGIDHYNYVINQLLAAGIEPMVTLYHWDLPQGLEDKYGGWLSPEIEVDFRAYADICFANFGDRVKKWVTLNEPWTSALQGYVTGNFAPGRCSDRSKCPEGNSSTEGYIAAHNMLNAHAAVIELYRTNYQHVQRGIIGITLNHDWATPLRGDVQSDIAAAQRRNEFAQGWFSDPINFGRYPQTMVDLVGSRLPVFSDAQKARLTGSYDFMGLNHYSTKYYYDSSDTDITDYLSTHCGNVSSSANVSSPRWGGWIDDQNNVESKYDLNCTIIGPQADSPWLNVVPYGFYNVIMWLHNRYSVTEGSTNVITSSEGRQDSGAMIPGRGIGSGPLLYITENGCDVPGESEMSVAQALNDTFRINFYSQYLSELDRAIGDGANVQGYFAWSLLDNFEWADGFSKRFGLHYVDYTKPERPRYAKNSAAWYARYVEEHRDTYPGRIVAAQTSGSGGDDGGVSNADPAEKGDEDDDNDVDDNACSEWKDCLWNAVANAVDSRVFGVQLFDT